MRSRQANVAGNTKTRTALLLKGKFSLFKAALPLSRYKMANFCPGDFPSSEASSFGRGKRRYCSSSSSGARKVARGDIPAAPLGVSQWGRQQLSHSGSHNSESAAVQAYRGGGKRQYQGRGGGRVGGGGWNWGEPDTSQPVRTAIQDLTPHMANSVSSQAETAINELACINNTRASWELS